MVVVGECKLLLVEPVTGMPMPQCLCLLYLWRVLPCEIGEMRSLCTSTKRASYSTAY